MGRQRRTALATNQANRITQLTALDFGGGADIYQAHVNAPAEADLFWSPAEHNAFAVPILLLAEHGNGQLKPVVLLVGDV
ncbi:MAG: hypothetical protein GX456_17500 [Verrucomicrobia bacterium]|nr:hypothetical protein [Verrucomicrobiota bacterium]